MSNVKINGSSNYIKLNITGGQINSSTSTIWFTGWGPGYIPNNSIIIEEEVDLPNSELEQLELPLESIKSEGLSCKKCDEFYPFAISNRDDNTLICWSCRHRI